MREGAATIAERAACARSTVGVAIKALEDCGLLSWVNRLVRVREPCLDLCGRPGSRIRVVRTGNAYQFHDPKAAETKGVACKSDFRSGTTNQDSPSSLAAPSQPEIDPTTELGAAILSFKASKRGRRNRRSENGSRTNSARIPTTPLRARSRSNNDREPDNSCFE